MTTKLCFLNMVIGKELSRHFLLISHISIFYLLFLLLWYLHSDWIVEVFWNCWNVLSISIFILLFSPITFLLAKRYHLKKKSSIMGNKAEDQAVSREVGIQQLQRQTARISSQPIYATMYTSLRSVRPQGETRLSLCSENVDWSGDESRFCENLTRWTPLCCTDDEGLYFYRPCWQ